MQFLKYWVLVSITSLVGCVTTEPMPPLDNSKTSDTTTIIAIEPPPYAEIPSDQLNVLLEAEFAIRARDLPLGLQKLMAASRAIPDPAIARRGLQLAQYLRQTDATLTMAKRVSDLDTNDAQAATLAAAILIEQGNVAEAIPYSQRAFSASSDINPAALLNGYANQDVETKKLIRDLIQSLGATHPNDPRALFAEALLAWRENKTTETEEALSSLFEISPHHERGTLLITEIRSQAGDPDAFDQLLEAIDATNSPLLRYQYARFLMEQEDLVAAKVQFDALVLAAPLNIDYVMGAALLDLELDKPAQALVNLDRVIGLQQRLDEAYLYKGVALARLGDTPSALKALQQVSPSASYARALREASGLLIAEGDPSASDVFFGRHRELHPDGTELSYLFHADTLTQQQSGDPLEVLSEGIRKHPQSTRLLFTRANHYERSNRFEKAEIDYRSVLAITPGDANALNALGYALTNNTERYSEAAVLLEEAISKDPRNPAIIDSLGWVYFKLGKSRQAEVLLKEAYQQYPDPEVASHLIELLWLQGRKIEARDLISAQLAASPKNRLLLDMAMRLSIRLSE